MLTAGAALAVGAAAAMPHDEPPPSSAVGPDGGATSAAHALPQPGRADAAQRLVQDAVDAATRALHDWLHARSGHFVAEPQTVPQPSCANAAASRLTVRPLPAGASVTRRMLVWVDVEAAGRVACTLPVAFAVRALARGWTARHDLAAGQPLLAEAFERREVSLVDTTALPLQAWPASARLRRPLRGGQVLSAAHVEAVPAVERGSRIAVRSRQGDVALEAAGQALQDGWPGQRILVRLGSSSAPLAAQVVSPGLAEVAP